MKMFFGTKKVAINIASKSNNDVVDCLPEELKSETIGKQMAYRRKHKTWAVDFTGSRNSSINNKLKQLESKFNG